MSPLRRRPAMVDAPSYLSRLKLRTPPFSQETAAERFYMDTGRAHYLDMLHHLSEYNEEVLLVVGPEGIGKSSLLERYAERREGHWRLCLLECPARTELADLFARLADCFGIAPAGGGGEEVWQALLGRLEGWQGSELPILLIDDAHNLTDEALEAVLHLGVLGGEQGKLLRLVLFAEEAIEGRLAGGGFAQLASPYRIEMQPISEAECASYLTQCLVSSGYRGASPFSDEEVARIYRQSGGVPALINRVAHAILLEQGGQWEGAMPTNRLIYRYGLLALALAAVGLWIYGQSGGQDQRGEAVVIEAPLPAAVPRVAVEPPVGQRADAVEPGQSTGEEASAPAGEVAQAVSQGATTAPDNGVAAPTLQGVSPSPVVGSRGPQEITLLGSGLEAGSRVAISWGDRVEALDPSLVSVPDPTHMVITITTGEGPVGAAVQVSSPANLRSNVFRFEVVAPPPEVPVAAEEAPAAEPPVAPVPSQVTTAEKVEETPKQAPPAASTKAAPAVTPAVAQNKEIAGREWVEAQPEGHYTLQLLAVSEPTGVTTFIAAHPQLDGPLARVELEREGRPLHLLLQGSYPTKEQAEAGRNQLPESVQAWPRGLAEIRKALPEKVPVPPVKEADAGGGIKDTAWLWSQDPSHYTIQLAAAGDEGAIEAVMQGTNLPGELAVVQTLRDARPWFVLVYGRFDSKDSALGAIERMPEPLKASGPWPRQFGTLQQEVAQAIRQ